MFVFLFDVGRSMFDVRRSSLETSPYGINATRECLQNHLGLLALMGVWASLPFMTFRIFVLEPLLPSFCRIIPNPDKPEKCLFIPLAAGKLRSRFAPSIHIK